MVFDFATLEAHRGAVRPEGIRINGSSSLGGCANDQNVSSQGSANALLDYSQGTANAVSISASPSLVIFRFCLRIFPSPMEKRAF